jgi:hypothetical protein
MLGSGPSLDWSPGVTRNSTFVASGSGRFAAIGQAEVHAARDAFAFHCLVEGHPDDRLSGPGPGLEPLVADGRTLGDELVLTALLEASSVHALEVRLDADSIAG